MLKKLQTLLDSPGQYKARLNDAVSLQRVQKEVQPPPTNQLSPQDLQRLYEVRMIKQVPVIGTHVDTCLRSTAHEQTATGAGAPDKHCQR